MTLEEFALNLKQEYINDRSQNSALTIAARINNAIINGRPLTIEEKERVLDLIENTYINGRKFICDSDNSDWIKAVAVLRSQVNGIKKK